MMHKGHIKLQHLSPFIVNFKLEKPLKREDYLGVYLRVLYPVINSNNFVIIMVLVIVLML